MANLYLAKNEYDKAQSKYQYIEENMLNIINYEVIKSNMIKAANISPIRK